MRWIILLMIVALAACSSESGVSQDEKNAALHTPLPKDISTVESIKSAMEKLSYEDRKLVLAFIERQHKGPAEGVNRSSSAKTIGDAIVEQQQFLKEKEEREAKAREQAKQLIAREIAEREHPADIKQQLLDQIKIAKLKWHREGFDSVMVVDLMFENKGARDVKDIELTCTHSSNSGTEIDRNSRKIYEIVRAGGSKQIHSFNMGFIHSQATLTRCRITDLTVL